MRYELENRASQLRLYDNQVDYATIYLSIDEVQEYTPVEEPTVWERISGGFVSSIKLFAGNTGLIYPDFISKNQNERIIADAKYKPVENIGNKDYLQVLAYMLRFDAKKGYYLYPEKQNRNSLELRVNSGVSFEKNIVPREDMKVIKHGLLIPDKVSNYEEFVQSIRQSEKKFVEYFCFNYNSMDFIKER